MGTTNSLWLPLVTFVRCNLVVWKPPSMCTQCVEQFFMPLDLGHICHGSISQMTTWLNYAQNILHSNVHPIQHLPAYPPNMLQTSSCGMLLGHSSKGISCSQLTINKKNVWGNPPTNFLWVGGILLLYKPIQ